MVSSTPPNAMSHCYRASTASSGRFQSFQVLHVPYGHLERENKELPKKQKEEKVIFEPSRQAEYYFLIRRIVQKKRVFYGQADRKPWTPSPYD